MRYGSQSHALLSSTPLLYSSNSDLALSDPGTAPGKEIPVEGSLLGIKRSVEEFSQLAYLGHQIPAGSKALALLDGSLIMWPLTSHEFPDFVINQMLDNGVLKSMNDIKALNSDSCISLASYISYPRSTDVVNTLRIALCPCEIPDCYTCQLTCEKDQPPCGKLSGIRDRDLFWELLKDNERSGLYMSRSRISKMHYTCNAVYFYYTKILNEVSRIEVPEWVAVDETLLNLSHSIIIDQCHKGQGYPVCLSEAHEQAVVSNNDRASFYRLVDVFMARNNLTISKSAKSLSKITRWV